MEDTIQITSFTGKSVQEWIPQIAELRIEVFAEYPFLYIGDVDYEKRYLKKFTTMENAIVVVAFDGDTPIGISTGYPFRFEVESLKEAFKKSGRNPEDYFGFGESILRKSYRGKGIGKAFFDHREAHVQKLGKYKGICFFTRNRLANDPKRPDDYRPLDTFWQSRGYKKHPEIIGYYPYQEIGEEEESAKEMVFWIKELS